jgi:hypothetical protein
MDEAKQRQKQRLRIIACTSVIAIAEFSAPLSGSTQQALAPTSESKTIIVRLSNFAFDPDHLRLVLVQIA